MKGDKARQEVCLIGRFLSLEVLILIMGIASLIGGIVYRQPRDLAAGALILASLLLLNAWCKHWVRPPHH